MKATKRSLIVSIAILCVCALSLTSASFAWFSASQSAEVQALTLGVQSQTDIKIAVNPDALLAADSAYWVSTLTSKDIKDVWGNDYVGDVTPKTQGKCDGNFLAPDETDRKSIGDDGKFTGTLKDTTDGYYKFTIYVRTTKNTSQVTYNSKGFSLADTAIDEDKTALEAMSIGDDMSQGIAKGSSAPGAKVIVDAASDLTALGDYFYTTVNFYIWVEGTDEVNCRNSRALSVYDYVNTITFGYGADLT